jgi:hypothetical protein
MLGDRAVFDSDVALAIQRNTIEPGEMVVGALVVEPPRETACKVIVAAAEPARAGASPKREIADPGPCRLSVIVSVDGEVHNIVLDELNASR